MRSLETHFVSQVPLRFDMGHPQGMYFKAGYTRTLLSTSAAWACPVQAWANQPGMFWANPSSARWQHMCCVPSTLSPKLARWLIKEHPRFLSIYFWGIPRSFETPRKRGSDGRLFPQVYLSLSSGHSSVVRHSFILGDVPRVVQKVAYTDSRSDGKRNDTWNSFC